MDLSGIYGFAFILRMVSLLLAVFATLSFSILKTTVPGEAVWIKD
jgi:hypothetical protein